MFILFILGVGKPALGSILSRTTGVDRGAGVKNTVCFLKITRQLTPSWKKTCFVEEVHSNSIAGIAEWAVMESVED